jgi:hypothetical protein
LGLARCTYCGLCAEFGQYHAMAVVRRTVWSLPECATAVAADVFPISMRAPVKQPTAEAYADAMPLVEGRPAYRTRSWRSGGV